MFSRRENNIKQTESLSEWISFDFFKNVIAEFQPAIKTVEERLMHYEDQLKPLLQTLVSDVLIITPPSAPT